MKHRHVFSTPDLDTARAAIHAARAAGVHDDDILLVARSDIELESIPDKRKEADTDMLPAALRGVGYGAGAGLLAWVVAVMVTSLGLTLIGAAAATAAGALLGGLSSALVGSSLPDPIRQKFHDQIEAGDILLVIDASEQLLTSAEPDIVGSGAMLLPYGPHPTTP